MSDEITGAQIFKKNPRARELLRQFMNNGGTGLGDAKAYRAGYTYAFELSEEQKTLVDKIREQKGISLDEAVHMVQKSFEGNDG